MVDAAERLATALDAAVRMALLEALSDAAAEITAALDGATVEVRLRGRDPDLVVTDARLAPSCRHVRDRRRPADRSPDEDDDRRRRRPHHAAASPSRSSSAPRPPRPGCASSLNTWLVDAVRDAADGSTPPGRRTGRRGDTHLTGWAR